MTDLTTKSAGNVPRQLFGYDVIDAVGEGAGSTIYAVSDPATRQIYALKHVLRKNEKDIRFVEQIENEHAVGALARHPGLRRTFNVKVERTLLRRVTSAALIMEMFDGLPLEMYDSRNFPSLVAAFILAADALDALHTMGYVHCDLKPNNILIAPDGTVKIIDLGQAAKIGTTKERIQGTPDFISPEQVKRHPVTPRTDVFNFGATMYWALAGRKMPTLFTLAKGENSFLVDDAILAPHQINQSVPENLSSLVMECVRTNPAKRVPDMGTLSRRLAVVQHGLKRKSTAKIAAIA